MTVSQPSRLARRLGARLTDRSATVRRIATFAGIGVVSTVAYVVLYALLRGAVPAQVANLVALAATAVGNTTANRRLTFSVRGRSGFLADQAVGLAAFAIALAITSGSIGLLQALVPQAGLRLEIAVIVAANVVATVVRYLVLQTWMDRRHPPARQRSHGVPEGAPQ
jgi:putative flippase GtrA